MDARIGQYRPSPLAQPFTGFSGKTDMSGVLNVLTSAASMAQMFIGNSNSQLSALQNSGQVMAASQQRNERRQINQGVGTAMQVLFSILGLIF